MAKNKLIPTWVKVAVVAALFVPFNVKVDKDENQKIKKVTARSIVAGVTYVSGNEDKEADLSLTFPGIADPESTTTAFSVDGEAIAKGARRFSDKAVSFAKKAAAGVGAFCEKFNGGDKDVLVSEPDEDTPDITVDAENSLFAEDLAKFEEELKLMFTE